MPPPESAHQTVVARHTISACRARLYWCGSCSPRGRGSQFGTEKSERSNCPSGDQVFIAELKRSSEGRRDRLVPLISQAILQAQGLAKNYPGRVVPVAIVAAPRVASSVADEIKRFAV